MTILMCAQKLTDASLIYRTVPKTKTSKMKKLKNKRTSVLLAVYSPKVPKPKPNPNPSLPNL